MDETFQGIRNINLLGPTEAAKKFRKENKMEADFVSHILSWIILHNEKGEVLHLNPKYIKFFGAFDGQTVIDADGFRFIAVDSVESIIQQLEGGRRSAK